ncbi:MAG: hypothetical protein IPI16_13500 [Comamonadaceae bacterium]|nr:hypothetical protein [Comamonadaceae bacterium]
MLLTPHFDSFYLGIAFLAQASGARINSMSSDIVQDSRVDPAVGRHFDRKYRGLEHYLNGGMVLDIEAGLRPFYRMLQNHETLVVLGDAPVLPNGASMTVDFLGAQRLIAAGALRLAQRSGSDLGGYVCRYLEQGRYELEMCPAGPSDDPETIGRIYRFSPHKFWHSQGSGGRPICCPTYPQCLVNGGAPNPQTSRPECKESRLTSPL